jgi:YegS/Rv2252/BmrU family lipid kinase
VASKIFLVVNPQSGNGRTGKQFDLIAQAVRARAGGFEHAFTSKPLDATDITRRALKDGFDVIVAVGGDGTVNEVVNGFFDGDRPTHPEAALALIPRGTGGDFRRTFGWSVELEAAANRLRGDSRPLDIGRVRYTDHAGKPAVRYFANIASFGASGQVDSVVNKSTKLLGGKISFTLGSVRALWAYHDQKCRVRLDDRPEEEVAVTTMAVANGQYFGGGMWVAPKAKPDDGIFDITLWTGYGLTDFALKGRSIYDGSHVKWAGTRTFQAKKVVATSDEVVLLDIDGEQPGRLPATFEILPAALKLKG